MDRTIPIKKNYEFMRIFKKGKFYVGKYMVLYILKNNLDANRLGITVNKKFGNSVKRNRVRRLVRENYRLYEEFVKNGLDIVIVARNTELLASFFDIKKEMKYLFKKLGMFDQEKWDCLKNC